MSACTTRCNQGRTCTCRRRVSEVDLDAAQAERDEAYRNAFEGVETFPLRGRYLIAAVAVVALVCGLSALFPMGMAG